LKNQGVSPVLTGLFNLGADRVRDNPRLLRA